MQSAKKLSNFTLTGWLPKSNDSFNNHVRLFIKSKHSVKTIWYVKEGQSGYHEIVSQEFYRLIIPGQQKTRRINTGIESEFVVASKDVGHFSPLNKATDRDLENLLLHGNVRNLGMACVVTLVVNDIDLPKRSLGTTASSLLAKIDGDHSFYSLRHSCNPADHAITHKVITELPLARKYAAYNWLDSRSSNIDFPSPILDKLKTNHAFITDVNRGSLRCLILPDALINVFALSCTRQNPDIGMIYANELKQRIDQLRHAMGQNINFMNFLTSVAAEQDIDIYWPYLFSFYSTQKNSLVQEANITKQDLLAELKALREFYAENSEEYTRSYAEQSANPTPVVSVQALFARMPNLRIRHRNEYAFPTKATLDFLNALTVLLQSDQFVPMIELEHFIHLAFEHQLACFEEIYTLINSKLVCTDELYPLSFMRQCRTHLSGFLCATDSEAAQTHAVKLEEFLEKYQNVFTDPGLLFDDHQGEVPVLHSTVGAHIMFFTEQTLHNLEIDKFYAWARTSPQVAKILFRLGFTEQPSIWSQIPSSFVRELCNGAVSFASFVVIDPCNKRLSYYDYLPLHYLIRFLQHCFAQKPALPIDVASNLTRATLENFIQAHRDELAIPEISSSPIAQYLVSMIKQLLEQSPQVGAAFVYDFYCNSDYQFGLFALRQARALLLPELITAPEVARKFCRYEPLDNKHPFHSIYGSIHYAEQPYLALLIDLTPSTLFYRDMIFALDFHFNVSRYPFKYFLRNAADDFASVQDTEATGIYNLIDLLDEIDSSQLLPPHLKWDLKLDFICTSDVSFEDLSEEVLINFHDLCFLTKNIIYANYRENHLPDLVKRCTHPDVAVQAAYITYVDILANSLPEENPISYVRALFDDLLMALKIDQLEQKLLFKP